MNTVAREFASAAAGMAGGIALALLSRIQAPADFHQARWCFIFGFLAGTRLVKQ